MTSIPEKVSSRFKETRNHIKNIWHDFLANTGWIITVYLATAVTFAYIYLYSNAQWNQSIDGLTALYLSFVTITTLGYGDIHPTNDYAMILTMLEVAIGIVLIGLCINSIGRKADKREGEKRNNIQKQTLLISYQTFKAKIAGYIVTYAYETEDLKEELSLKHKLTKHESFRSEFSFFKYDEEIRPLFYAQERLKILVFAEFEILCKSIEMTLPRIDSTNIYSLSVLNEMVTRWEAYKAIDEIEQIDEVAFDVYYLMSNTNYIGQEFKNERVSVSIQSL